MILPELLIINPKYNINLHYINCNLNYCAGNDPHFFCYWFYVENSMSNKQKTNKTTIFIDDKHFLILAKTKLRRILCGSFDTYDLCIIM